MGRSLYVKPFSKCVNVCLTEEQYQVVVDYCKKAHVSMAFALREAFLEKHPVPEDKE